MRSNSAAQVRHDRLRKKLPEGWDLFHKHLLHIVEAGKKKHRSLLGVHFVRPEKLVDMPQMLAELGLSDWRIQSWDFEEQSSQNAADANDGGVTFFLMKADALRSLVFIKTAARETQQEQQGLDCMNIAVAFHEFGHVDDFERQRNFVPGKAVSLTNAEFYAHQYACKQMMKRNQRYPLVWYLYALETQLSRSPNDSHRNAAQQFLSSGEYKNCRSFVGPFYIDFANAQTQGKQWEPNFFWNRSDE